MHTWLAHAASDPRPNASDPDTYTQGRPTFNNPIFGESLYELCRKATTRQIDYPDEILNQQVGMCIHHQRHWLSHVLFILGDDACSKPHTSEYARRAGLTVQPHPAASFTPQIVHMINEERATPMAAAVCRVLLLRLGRGAQLFTKPVHNFALA